MKKLSTSGAFIQWSMLLWLLPSECLPFWMKLMTCNDLRGPTCLWLCSLCLHHRRRYLFRSCPGTFVKTSFHVFNVIEWSLWPASHVCDIWSLWLRLGVFVTVACITMCMLRVFVIQLPLPVDIRLAIFLSNGPLACASPRPLWSNDMCLCDIGSLWLYVG